MVRLDEDTAPHDLANANANAAALPGETLAFCGLSRHIGHS